MSWIEGAGAPDLPDIFQVLAINPEALDTVKQLNETLSFGNSPLGRVREEAIATVVAVANRCRFGALTHSGFLRQYTGDQQTAADMLVNHHLAGLDPADRQMLDFAVQATLKPSTLTKDHIENLRRVGFDDQEILSIILVTCLVNFMNRLADSLGIDIPPSYQKAVEKWLTGPAGRQPWLMKPVSQRANDPSESPLAGSLGPNGWAAATDWHDPDGGATNGFAGSLFGNPRVSDPAGIDLDVKPGEEVSDLHLDGAQNGLNLGDLEHLLAEVERLELDALVEDGDGESPGSGSLDVMPVDAGQEDTLENGELLGLLESPELEPLPGELPAGPAAAPAADAGEQPPAESQETTYTIATTPLETPQSQEEPDVEGALEEQEEEEVVLVDPNNPVAQFVGNMCVVDDGEVTSARDLYIAYLRWCDENIEPPMPQRGFGMILTQMGFHRRRRGRSRNWSWWGVGLGDGDTGDEDENLDPGSDLDSDSDSDYSNDLTGEE